MKTLYQFLKLIVKICLRAYYPKTRVLNRSVLQFDHPAILVSNHPNTLLDVLHAAARTNNQVFFLANAGMFGTPFTNWLFNKLYCIPIQRLYDTGGKPTNNKESFQRCRDFLAGGGCLYIAPEGGSEPVRWIRKLKTGSARIGLSTEEEHNFQLGLKIMPVGLNYEAPGVFNTGIVINAGQPIAVADYKEEYLKDPIQTARKMTLDLEERMKSLVIHAPEIENDRFHRRLEQILQHQTPLGQEEAFDRAQQVVTKLSELKEQSTERWNELYTKVEMYFQGLQQQGLTERGLFGRLQRTSVGKSMWQLLVLLFGAPIFLYGVINNVFALGIPGLLSSRLKLYKGYKSTIEALSGLLTVPIFYWLQFNWVQHLTGNTWALIYLLSLPLSVVLTWQYCKFAQGYRESQKAGRCKRRQPAVFEALTKNRSEIISILDKEGSTVPKIMVDK